MTELANNLPSLPNSWAYAKVSEIVHNEPLTGRKLKQSDYKEKGKFPVIDQGQNFIGGYTDKGDYRIETRTPVIIFGDHTKVIKYADFAFVAGADGVKVLVPSEVFFPKLLYYFLKALKLPNKGYARHYQYLEKSFLPVPPLKEQIRISSKIEEFFSFLDTGTESLRKVQAQLKRYRQAVLKYAFEGKLTEEWRKTHKEQMEPAQKTLETINRKINRKPSPLDVSAILPKLPEEWTYAKLGDICSSVDQVNPKTESAKEFTYLEIASIDSNQRITAPTKYLGKNAPSRARQLVKTGDTLFSTVRTYLRHIALVDEVFNNQIASTGFCVIRPLESLNSKWLFDLIQTDSFLNPLNKIQRGTSYPAVRNSDVFDQIIPLAPLTEQKIIANEIEKYLSQADEAQITTEKSLRVAKNLRQSILKKAFEGSARALKQPFKSSVLIFASGKIVITGLKSSDQIEPVIQQIKGLLACQ